MRKEASDLNRALLTWLETRLGLECGGDLRKAFAAFLGQQRLQRAGLAVSECAIISRYPLQLTGECNTIAEHLRTPEILDPLPIVSETKVWQLLVFLWQGAGGHDQILWDAISGCADVMEYRQGQLQQAWKVIWASFSVLEQQLHENNSLEIMKAIGGDGLDKKSRLASARLETLSAWHVAVPSLTKALQSSLQVGHAKALFNVMKKVTGMKKDLFQKEFIVALNTSCHLEFRAIVNSSLVFGPGSREGCRLFLGLQENHLEQVGALLLELQSYMAQVHQNMPARLRQVSIADVEIFACYAVNYARMAARAMQVAKDTSPARLAKRIGYAAGFLPHVAGVVEDAYRPRRYVLPKHVAVSMPSAATRRTRSSLAESWGYSLLADHWQRMDGERALKRNQRKSVTSRKRKRQIVSRSSSYSGSSSDGEEFTSGQSEDEQVLQVASTRSCTTVEASPMDQAVPVSVAMTSTESVTAAEYPVPHAMTSAESSQLHQSFTASISTTMRPAAEATGEAAEAPLPPGWENFTSKSTGQIYYFHQDSGTSQFEKPASEIPSMSAAPPDYMWKMLRSRSTGNLYYFNESTGESTFESPVNRIRVPGGWQAAFSASTGRLYYWHMETLGSQFERPPA